MVARLGDVGLITSKCTEDECASLSGRRGVKGTTAHGCLDLDEHKLEIISIIEVYDLEVIYLDVRMMSTDIDVDLL